MGDALGAQRRAPGCEKALARREGIGCDANCCFRFAPHLKDEPTSDHIHALITQQLLAEGGLAYAFSVVLESRQTKLNQVDEGRRGEREGTIERAREKDGKATQAKHAMSSNMNMSAQVAAVRREIEAEKLRRVHRRRAEDRFMQGLRGNYAIEHFGTIHEEVRQEERGTVVPARVRRQAVRHTVHKDPCQQILSFGSNVRCFEVTQGGATVWAADHDGAIAIISGVSGAVVHTVAQAPASGATVDVLLATETHMWVGRSDGTVQVFDFLVFLHITEGTFHTGAVTAFAATADGRMYSAGADGALVRWDTEERTFEALSKIVTGHTAGITAAAAHAAHVFTGSADSTVRGFDVNTGALAFVLEGHTAAVAALAVVDGLLFSGAADKTLRVWAPADNGSCLKTLELSAACATLTPDEAAHRLLVGLDDGTIEQFRTLPEDGFQAERTFSEHAGRSLVGVKTFTAVNSIKIWSLASNGVNRVWYSGANQVAEAMERTTSALKAVIQQDTVELDRWRALVARLRTIDARRKFQLAHALEAHHQELLRRRYAMQWREAMRVRTAHRRRELIATRLAFEHTCARVRADFGKWFRWYRTVRNARVKRSFSAILMATTRRNIVVYYFRKMQAYARRVRDALKRQELMALMASRSGTALQRIYFRRLLEYRALREARSKRLRYAESMLRGACNSVLRYYYLAWRNVAHRREYRARRAQMGRMLLDLTVRGRRVHAYQKWFALVHRRVLLRRKQEMAAVLVRSTERGLEATYFMKWILFRARHAGDAAVARRDACAASLAHVQAKYQALHRVVEEKKAVDALAARAAAEAHELEARRLRLETLRMQRAELLDRLSGAELAAQQRRRSVQDQMLSLIFALKVKVLNFHADFALVHQVHEKLRQGTPVTKIFLEAHQAVKRIIVDVTKQPHLNQEEWPLTPEMITKFPSHHLSTLLAAIKALVITFDVMDQETRASIQSDAEIVTNARWVLLIADVCMSHRNKVLHRK